MMLKAKLLAGGGVETQYIDSLFSAYTYTGNGSTQTITNGIDLSGSGGLVWTKNRSNASSNSLVDTTRGVHKYIQTNSTAAEGTSSATVTAFSSTGFSIGSDGWHNASSQTYVSWTFRNADKFYNHTTVVKSSGSNATVSFSNLTTLGMVRVKRTDSTGSWYIWHRSLTAGKLLIGETTAAEATLGHITVSGTTVTLVNGTIADGTYLVEGFAHDTGTDGLIQCGSYTTDGDGTAPIVTLGWEPQYVMIKRTNSSSAGDWQIWDSSRGFVAGSQTSYAEKNSRLFANTSAAEDTTNSEIHPTSTGFLGGYLGLGTSSPYIYLAIRRPNKPPTTGTQVYNAIARTGTGAAATVTGVGFAPDLSWAKWRTVASGAGHMIQDRLRGTNYLDSSATSAEAGGASDVTAFNMDGVSLGTDSWINQSTATYANWYFKRAPGVFDVVCYTGTGSATTVAHGLGAVPELMIVKGRSIVSNWFSYYGDNTKRISLETASAATTDSTAWNNTTPTASVFSVGTANNTNYSGGTFVAYLFATLAGISKVGSYTGNGSSQTINCGFTTGARFVLIKRTDSTGDWYVWDTARGIVASTDPHLSLNTTAAEVTTDDSIDPDTTGFVVNQLAATNINVTSASYIYLAFA